MNVLVVEVDPAAIHTLKVLLKLGHKVMVSKNGADGLTVLAKKPFDLLMVNVDSPGLGGEKAVAVLREKEKTAGKRVLVVGLGELPHEGGEPGSYGRFDHFLSRPLQQRQLLELMENLSAPAVPRAEAEETGEKSPINQQAGLAICDGDEELFQEILKVFLVDAPDHIVKLKNAVGAGDAALMQRHAHALKGASGNICAEPFKEAVMQVERAAKNGDLEQGREMFIKVVREYKRLMHYINRLLPPDSPSEDPSD
ncbi:MAG: Hpt domain-containing protein [Nitrospinae bacterium]|nr:Hpt domain-containing protein [Nitrospinota bacterium]